MWAESGRRVFREIRFRLAQDLDDRLSIWSKLPNSLSTFPSSPTALLRAMMPGASSVDAVT